MSEIILKQTLRSKIYFVIVVVIFIALMAATFLEGERVVSAPAFIFLSFILFVILKKNRLIITVDEQGFIPHWVLPKNVTYKVLWSEVKEIYIMKQEVKGRTYRCLAIDLHNPDLLHIMQNSWGRFSNIMNKILGDRMSDSGKAEVYIYEKIFPSKKFDELVQQLISLHKKAESNVSIAEKPANQIPLKGDVSDYLYKSQLALLRTSLTAYPLLLLVFWFVGADDVAYREPSGKGSILGIILIGIVMLLFSALLALKHLSLIRKTGLVYKDRQTTHRFYLAIFNLVCLTIPFVVVAYTLSSRILATQAF